MKPAWRIVLSLAVLVLVGIALQLRLAGVTATVINGSDKTIDDVRLQYERGVFHAGTLRAGEAKSVRLGKIGEGGTFVVAFTQNERPYRATRDIYFGLRMSTELKFEVLGASALRVTINGTEVR